MTPDPTDVVPVVGLGGSAGGLDAVCQLLEEMPSDTGMAFVYVGHLAPEHESHVADTLGRCTEMPVHQAEDHVRVEPDHVYVIPPAKRLELEEGLLRVTDDPREGKAPNVIDRFFRSLAEQLGRRTVGVVLSGTLTDGTAGLRDIRAQGGFTLVQDPKTADYRSMPEAAMSAGHVDLVGSPKELAEEIVRLGRDALTRAEPQVEAPGESDGLMEVFDAVREGVGVDFSQYKKSTVRRRLHRRMLATGVQDLSTYVERLRDDPDEVLQLYHEFLIQVTGFFRDPESFEELEEEILPALLEDRDPDDEIRIWVPACATGEEAYSLAMLLEEAMQRTGQSVPFRVFGTDVSKQAIATAREGTYSGEIESDVSEERLERFFTQDNGRYRIDKRIRGQCVFATQDITRDPPFSNMDVVSCRNLLIYLEPDLQKRVVAALHYALKPDGVLLVGQSEKLERYGELFEAGDPAGQTYRKRDVTNPLVQGRDQARSMALDRPTPDERPGWSEDRTRREADRVMLERHAPPSVLVTPELEIIEFRGEVERYLKHSTGDPSLNLRSMAREGLAVELDQAVRDASESGETIRRRSVKVRRPDGAVLEIDVEVVPFQTPGSERPNLLVVFHDEADRPAEHQEAPDAGPGLLDRLLGSRGPDQEEQVAELEEELEATQAYLQNVVEEYEATTEELRSANEEALSTNEELQSTNEELQTAKEELQSTNEELQTLNEELQERNEEIQRINNDLVNLLESVDVPILMLDEDLAIRRFTPRAEEDLNLIPTDIGRPITDIRLPLDVDDLEETIRSVVQNLQHTDMDVTHEEGRRFSLRITPYQTGEKEIEGAVLTLMPLHGGG